MITRDRAYALRRLIEKASAFLDDADALDGVELYAVWKPDTLYEANERLRYGDKLFRVRQDHTSQAQYPPGIDTAALYAEIVADEEAGTRDNPIAYDGNMALEQGKYYTQAGVLYLCTRDTINPVYNPLADLVGLYVEIVKE